MHVLIVIRNIKLIIIIFSLSLFTLWISIKIVLCIVHIVFIKTIQVSDINRTRRGTVLKNNYPDYITNKQSARRICGNRSAEYEFPQKILCDME